MSLTIKDWLCQIMANLGIPLSGRNRWGDKYVPFEVLDAARQEVIAHQGRKIDEIKAAICRQIIDTDFCNMRVNAPHFLRLSFFDRPRCRYSQHLVKYFDSIGYDVTFDTWRSGPAKIKVSPK